MAELHDIRGIGPATATLLADHGLTSVKKLAKADLDAITAVAGFGPVRAAAVRADALAALPTKAPKAKAPKAKAKAEKQKPPKDPKFKKKSSKAKKKTKKG